MGMKGKIALGAVVGVVVIGVVSANAGSDSGSGDKGKDTSASADRESGKKADAKTGDKADKAEKKVAFKGDGDFQVGTDIKPGTYRTTGNTDDMCYWERAKDASGEVDSLLANDNVSGTSYVTIKASDKLFKSSGCKDWEAVDAKASGSPASQIKGNGGMYRVGADIAPGTYKSTGNTDDSCYWERDKDATHSMDSIVANNNVTGMAVVTISAGDGYFKTTGCGDWKKTG
ncbi:hypothetical protein [Streptomyces sp. NBC_01236]|uniref:hypothetical protein n=1 Tax=Streptomyces sp. NBC_01236 TaxID=2903789 RepID=UPI002E16188A|nr:hypothetical protein OG324_20120 [Streptomyces sp. NBC_01236]